MLQLPVRTAKKQKKDVPTITKTYLAKDVSDDDDTLSEKYKIELNAVAGLRDAFPDKCFDSIMKVLTATSKKTCHNEANHSCHAGCFVVSTD
ncbi:1846_t:CDS:2 [Diversispora eburnea]|uniref:1846_t:CDS:1 n=1 Tax=Diversispora eburnea TaxID=1213867 RepID=A0A9N9CJR3_9GLOM|nr:1846_t:CDS:2 [Diversispora eburnea]